MTTRVMMALAIAIASVGCKGKESTKDKDPAKGTGEASGTGKASGTGAPSVAPDAAPAGVKVPDALPSSAHAVALEASVRVFVTVDAGGGLGFGLAPADRKVAWPAPKPIPHAAVLADLGNVLVSIRMGAGDAELAERVAEIMGKAGPAPTSTEDPVGDMDREPPMVLDEGKMGGRPDRTRSPRVGHLALSDASYAGLGTDLPAAVAPGDRRVSTGLARSEPDDDLLAVILADASADATRLVDVLAVRPLGPMALAVRDASGALARSVMRFGFPLYGYPYSNSDELLVDLGPDGVVVRSGPGATHATLPWNGDSVDAAALVRGYQASSGPDDKQPTLVHVTVTPGVSVARLVAVSDALIGGGITELIVRNWTRPDLHGPLVRTERPEVASGEVSSEAILTAVRVQGAALRACYTDALAKDATLEGKASVAVVFAPGGPVKDVVVQKLDVIAACTADAMRKLELTHGDGDPVSFQLTLIYRNVP